MKDRVAIADVAREGQRRQPPNVCSPLLPHQPQRKPLTASVDDEVPALEEYDGMPFGRRFSSPLLPVLRKVHDHCHYEWVAVVFFTITLIFLFVFVFYYNSPPKPRHCVTPLGIFLGESNGVSAFSNCNRDYHNVEEHFVFVKTSRIYSGVKWNALEYAQRFWLLARRPGVQFMSVKTAEDVWNKIEEVSAVRGGARVKLLKYANAPREDSKLRTSTSATVAQWRDSMPQKGDMLIYARDKNIPEGHVAVIVGVAHLPNDMDSKNSSLGNYILYLAEQNWDNRPWVDVDTARLDGGSGSSKSTPVLRHYSRTVMLLKERATLTMSVSDQHAKVLGWVRV